MQGKETLLPTVHVFAFARARVSECVSVMMRARACWGDVGVDVGASSVCARVCARTYSC